MATRLFNPGRTGAAVIGTGRIDTVPSLADTGDIDNIYQLDVVFRYDSQVLPASTGLRSWQLDVICLLLRSTEEQVDPNDCFVPTLPIADSTMSGCCLCICDLHCTPANTVVADVQVLVRP
jgi:hypothetical protein